MPGIVMQRLEDGSIYVGHIWADTVEEAQQRLDREGEIEAGAQMIGFVPFGNGDDPLMRMLESLMELTYDFHAPMDSKGHEIDLFLAQIFEAGRNFGKHEK